MAQKRILLAAGHGYRPDNSFDPGAINPNDHTKEHDINIDVVNYALYALKAQNVFTVLTDTLVFGTAHEPNWQKTKTYVKQNKLDLAIEVHHDSYNAKDAGFGIMPRTPYYSAQLLCGYISQGFRDRQLPTKPSYRDIRGLGFIRGLTTPVLIWECGATKSQTEAIYKARGYAIAEGITKWFGLKFIPPVGK